ncbi:hypothetical protein [Patulibacter defluvii]|uniref:hypothetical protein n=1 Tax=Patulibacter defluvii TaxID=3095358 RepID=UPI002A762837|nr:hypothetical protein [Patulibacter sp. DM4]
MATRKPYSRQEYAVALAVNAAATPFNVAILVGVTAAGVVVGGPVVVVLLVAIVLYLVAAGRTFLDPEVADRVIAGVRADRRRDAERGRRRLDPATLSPEVAGPLLHAREREARIRAAIDRAELPYAEVSDEVDRFLDELDSSARRAQLLHEVLVDDPPAAIRRRLAQVSGDPAKRELADALGQQLAVGERCEQQLGRYYDETERLLVELDTIRANLVSVSASTDASQQRRIGSDVRHLREEVSVLAEGMRTAYDGDPPAPDA